MTTGTPASRTKSSAISTRRIVLCTSIITCPLFMPPAQSALSEISRRSRGQLSVKDVDVLKRYADVV